MTKVEVIRTFSDKETGVYYNVGEIVEFTPTRIKEIKKSSEEFGFDFIKEIKESKKGASKSKGSVDGTTED